MLNDKFDRDFYLRHLAGEKCLDLFPSASNRKQWSEIFTDSKFHHARKYELLGATNFIKECPWPELTATDYRRFVREGNRNIYEKLYFRRRNMLGVLVLAECIIYDGSYMDAIIDGIWAILSEPDWCIHAHATYLPGDSLPDPDAADVDIFAAATGMLLSTTLSLLGERLREHSPGMSKRLKRELLKRIVEPVERSEDYWWLAGRNNWSPWCSANVLITALQCLDDRERLVSLILKLQNCIEKFIGGYSPDGACDEGVNYWSLASGTMLIFLEQLNAISGNGLAEVYQEPLIRNMGEYVAKVNICGKYNFSYSDSSPISGLRFGVVYRFGERIRSKRLTNLVAASIFGFGPENDVPSLIASKSWRNCGDILFWGLADLFWVPSGINYHTLELPCYDVLPDMQVMVARQAIGGTEGFVLCSKAGSNFESHNHNDVGQFELFYNGEPLVIDLGVGIYTRKTFSKERYSIREIGAQGHNIPQVNGFLQERNEFKAKTSFSNNSRETSMNMEISASYPKAANIVSLCRTSAIDRISGEVQVTDNIEMKQGAAELMLPLYVHVRPVLEAKAVIFPLKTDEVVLNMENWESAGVEKIDFDDDKLSGFWGRSIYKLTLRCSFASGKGHAALKFKTIRDAVTEKKEKSGTYDSK